MKWVGWFLIGIAGILMYYILQIIIACAVIWIMFKITEEWRKEKEIKKDVSYA